MSLAGMPSPVFFSSAQVDEMNNTIDFKITVDITLGSSKRETSLGIVCSLTKAVKNYGGYLTGAIKVKGEEIVIVGSKNQHVWLVKME